MDKKTRTETRTETSLACRAIQWWIAIGGLSVAAFSARRDARFPLRRMQTRFARAHDRPTRNRRGDSPMPLPGTHPSLQGVWALLLVIFLSTFLVSRSASAEAGQDGSQRQVASQRSASMSAVSDEAVNAVDARSSAVAAADDPLSGDRRSQGPHASDGRATDEPRRDTGGSHRGQAHAEPRGIAQTVVRGTWPGMQACLRRLQAPFVRRLRTLRSMRRRARGSGMIPTATVRLRRAYGNNISASSTDAFVGTTRLSSGEDLAVYAGVNFRLPDLMYHRQELPMFREANRLRMARDRRVAEFLDWYFRGRQAWIASVHQNNPEALRALWEADQRLNVLTTGLWAQLRHPSEAQE